MGNAPHQGKIFRITERSVPGSSQFGTSGTILSGAIRPVYSLEIIEPGGKVLYKFPNIQGILDLYESVRFQTENVEDIIRRLADRQ